jgi:hypothetical protein
MIKEQTRTASSGYLALVVLPALTLLFAWLFIRAAMVSNLLVVLCGEENARPVLNTGSLYS